MFAAQFPLELGDRVDARIGAQASQPLGVARTGVLRRDRLRLRLLRRRHLGRVIDGGSGLPRRLGGGDAFEQALHLGFQPNAGKLALKAGNRVPRRVGAQARQTLFVAAAGERRIGGGLRRWRRGRGRWRRRRFGRLDFRERLTQAAVRDYRRRWTAAAAAGGLARTTVGGSSLATAAGGAGAGSIFFAAGAGTSGMVAPPSEP